MGELGSVAQLEERPVEARKAVRSFLTGTTMFGSAAREVRLLSQASHWGFSDKGSTNPWHGLGDGSLPSFSTRSKK